MTRWRTYNRRKKRHLRAQAAWGESANTPLADIQRTRKAMEWHTFAPMVPEVLTQAEFDRLKEKLAEKHDPH